MTPLDIMVPVWGKKYCDYLCNYFLPSLMSPKNLPLLRAEDGHRLLLATDRDSWEYIIHRPVIAEILEHISPTFIEIIDPQTHDGTFAGYSHVIKSQTYAQIKLLKTQTGRGCLVSPDFIFSDGVIQTILLHKGLVLIPMLRQTEEDFPVGHQWEPRTLARLMVQHLHPEMLPYFGHLLNPPFRLFMMPTGLLFYTHHAVMFGFPPGGEIPSNIECEYFGKNFTDAYIVQDSDECCVACIGPRSINWSTSTVPGPDTLAAIRQTSKIYSAGMPLKARLLRTPIRWHWGMYAEWRAKEREMERRFYWALDNYIFGLILDSYILLHSLLAHLKGFLCQRYIRWRGSSSPSSARTKTRFTNGNSNRVPPAIGE